MKKAKLLLTIIAAVAIAGGALAFKTQNRGTDHYCTTDNGGTNCANPVFGHLGLMGPTLAYATTTVPNCGGSTNPGIECTSSGIIVIGE